MLDWTSITKGEDIDPKDIKNPLPLLPIKHAVLLPGVILPITITRKKSLQFVKKFYQKDALIAVVTQKNTEVSAPKLKDMYQVGTLAKILRLVKLPDDQTHVIVYGRARFSLEKLTEASSYMQAEVKLLPDKLISPKTKEKDVIHSLRKTFSKLLSLHTEVPRELKSTLQRMEDVSLLVHFMALHMSLSVEEKQRILEIISISERTSQLLEYMQREMKMLKVRNEVKDKTFSSIDQQQRDYFLRQQIKVLQDELGGPGSEQEIVALELQASKKKWSQEAAQHFQKELERLQQSPASTPEYALLLNYLKFMLSLPWGEYTQDRLDLEEAERILHRNHYGILKVKNRLIEHLAVLKLTQSIRGPILCLCGPPGVGKTSLGRSIAKALNRNYTRISLGGMHDEAEIRGHRKTYIGAMPGRILQQLSKLKSSNPVIVLDEIDKVHRDFRGDPSSALLEVLDPTENVSFMDNYLEIGYDLSQVLFVTTANTIQSIQSPLLDRMEVIHMSGYTLEEKLHIAKKHLVPSTRKSHGLKASQIRFSTTSIEQAIVNYTRESGVRSLQKNLASVARRVARFVATDTPYEPNIGEKEVREALGVPHALREEYINTELPGICTGLAWTETGGELLSIETTLYPGKGKLQLSGQLGEVMKESAMAAFSYLRTYAKSLDLADELFTQYDLHLHVPSGAVPKDGPSAGITILTAMASLYTQRRVQPYLAMSGELTLSGRVLPVGGIKEKVLAARAGGVRTIIFSETNQKDIEDLDRKYTKDFQIHYKKLAYEVIEEALVSSRSQRMALQYVPSSTQPPIHAG